MFWSHKAAIAAITGLTALTVSNAGQAAPILQGPYNFDGTSICQIQTVLQTNGINTTSSGGFSQSIGTIVFTPSTAGAAAGTIYIATSQIEGSLMLQQNPPGTGTGGMPVSGIKSATHTGTYAIAAGVLTVTTGTDPTQSYKAMFSAIGANNVAKTVMLLGHGGGGANCSHQITAFHQ